MAECFLVQNGGISLNFKVICNPQPETAKENTIWVDTDRINNYYFSATQPENMAEYDVWFHTGTSSTVAFSATKKNPVMVYPKSAKQYIGGAWVDVTAKSYQGGKWVDWVVYLFASGIGEKVGFKIIQANTSKSSIIRTKEYVRINCPTASGSELLWFTEDPVNLNSVSKVVFEAKCTNIPNSNATYMGQFILLNYKPTNANAPSPITSSTTLNADSQTVKYEVNVPSGGGNYYVGYWGQAAVDIYNVFLRGG